MNPPTLHGKVPSEPTGAVAGERWPGGRLTPWQADLFAVVATAATLGLRLAIDGQLGGQLLLVIFTVPIMLSAYLGGLRAGLLATAISFFGASYYLLPPFHSFAVASSVERWQQFFVVLAGGFISILSEALHRARARAERATREQQEAEAGRQESEGRFRAYFEEAADAMFIYDDTGRFLDVNPPACAGLGYTREELLAMSLFDIEAVFDLPRAQAVWSRMVPGQPSLLRGRHRRKDGSTFPVEVRLGCFDAEGRRCFFATTRDITERDQQEAATARALERLHEAQRIGQIGDWEFDLGTGAITWSPEVFVIIGRDPVLGPPRSYEENAAAFEPASAALMAEKVAAVIATGTAQEYEVVALRPDGQRVVVQATAVPRTDKEGKVTGLYGTVQDITERQRAERLMRESEERLSFAMEAAQIGDWDMDLRTNVARRSLRHDQCFGYSALVSEWGYETFLAHVQPVDRARVDDTYQRAMAGGGDYDVEFQVAWPDGSLHWLWSKGRFYFDDAGLPYRAAGIQMDITARKATEEALQKSAREQRELVALLEKERAKLLAAQEVAKIGSWETDLATGEVDWSAETHRIFETDPASFHPTHAGFLRLVHLGDRTMVDAAFQKGLSSRATWAHIHRIVMADGRIKIVEERWRTVFDDRDQPRAVVGTCQDITERQQAEGAALRLAAIVESSDDAIIGKNLENIVTSWNAGAERLFGYTAAEMVGASILWLFPPERHAEEAMILAQIVQGKTIRHFETVRVRKDGSLVDVAVTISAIRDATGEIVGASKLARDITEQKKAAEELRRSEASLANAQRIARLGNWDLDIATQSLFWSAEIYEIFGLSRAEFGASYEAFLAAVHPEDRARVDAAQRAALTGEARLDLEHRVVRPDGTERVVHEIADLICDATGRPIRLAGTVQDITERVQAAAKLRESERQFQTMLDAMAPLAWMAEADGSIYWYNQQWFDFTGTTPEQMKGWGWQRVHDPELLPRVLARWKAAIGSGEPFEMDFPLRAADGSYRWFLTRAVPLKDSRGVVVRWLGTNTDITTQREAAEEIANLNATLEQRVIERTEALRESEQRLAIAVQAAQAGVWAWDIKGERLEWSPEVFRLFGLNPTKEEVSLEIWRGLVHPEDRAGAERRMADALRHQTPLKNEYRVVLPTGELRWVSVLGATSYAENGEPVRMSGVCLDMTERKHGELELQKLAAKLRVANQELEAYSTAVSNDLRVAEAADRIKSAFLATMSHELRTPLNSIIGFTGIVLLGKAGPLNAEQAKQLGMVRESAHHLLALINDVLDLSKIEAGQLNVSAAPFDLRAAIEKVLGMISPLAEKKGLALEAQVAAGVGAMVSDRRRIEQILVNLLSNAVKFTERGAVTLTAELIADFRPAPEAEAGPAVRLRVTDTGIGIRPEDLAQLFQPFHQIDTGLDREAEGTGLGLAISRRLATLLGGEIDAASKWSQGSEFTVILPLEKPSAS